MTRLTKEMRESIAIRASNTSFLAEYEAIKKEEHKIGMALYEEAFDKKVRGQAARMPKHWMRQDGCLRFNCGGYDLTFTVKEAVPVPSSTHCARLANITGELAVTAQKHAEKIQDLKKRNKDAQRALLAMLHGIGSIKQLKNAWPEGAEFYSMYDIESPKAGVPAVQIAEINSMLGLKPKKSK
jgi:hypothetical protein